MSTQLTTFPEPLENSVEQPRMHSLWSIGIAAMIGGAFASGYLIYNNYVLVNQVAAAKRAAALFSAIGFIALFSAWNIPPDFIFFMLWVGGPQILVVVLAAWCLQAVLFTEHKSNEGKFRSVWFALWVGVIANVAIKLLFYGISIAIAG